jgi:D-alanine-D-alanine ligase
MGRATTADELASLLKELSAESDEVLIESMITGPEFSCPVLEQPDGSLQALPPIEIRPIGSSYFDFHAKYTDNASEEIVPAPRPAALLERIQECACAVHRLVGCNGVSRTDMILKDDKLYILETNTLPGLTRNSLLPKSYRAAGGTYEQLVDLLIDTAVAAAARRH